MFKKRRKTPRKLIIKSRKSTLRNGSSWAEPPKWKHRNRKNVSFNWQNNGIFKVNNKIETPYFTEWKTIFQNEYQKWNIMYQSLKHGSTHRYKKQNNNKNYRKNVSFEFFKGTLKGTLKGTRCFMQLKVHRGRAALLPGFLSNINPTQNFQKTYSDEWAGTKNR